MGELMAIGAALVWSFSVILFKRSSDMSPVGLNLLKNLVAIVLLALTMFALSTPFDWDRSNEDWALILVSGVFGISLADTLFFAALNRLGAGLLAVVECVYTPFVVLMSVFWLGEDPSDAFYVGTGAVFLGLLIATLDPKIRTDELAPNDFAWGVFFGVTAMATMAVGIVIVKPAIERSDLIEVTQLRLIFGAVGLVIWIGLRGIGREVLEVLRPGDHWAYMIPAAFLGAYLAMILWIGSMKYAPAAVAGVLSQTATVFTLLLSWWILKEHMTKRKLVGAFAAVVGAIIIGLYS